MSTSRLKLKMIRLKAGDEYVYTLCAFGRGWGKGGSVPNWAHNCD